MASLSKLGYIQFILSSNIPKVINLHKDFELIPSIVFFKTIIFVCQKNMNIKVKLSYTLPHYSILHSIYEILQISFV